ncbi:MAG: DUF2892 domain-containing protein [Nitrospirae bacterium]|nr:DUF2892 domain-containing protein [Nitrospirota bacterium]
MKKNVGTIDKTIRIIAGVLALGLGGYFGSWWGAIGLVPLLTAFIRWCPAYSIFGINTCGASSCSASACCSSGKHAHTS